LNEENRLFIAFGGDVIFCLVVQVINGQIIEVADVFTFTLFSNIGIKPLLIEVIIASLQTILFG
jgi:hypothetical protein